MGGVFNHESDLSDASLDEPAGDESTLIRIPAKIEATSMSSIE